MNIQVMLFGSLAQIVGKNSLEVNACQDTLNLKNELVKAFPNLNKYQFVIAVNKQIVNENTKINNGDVVALLPPFAGG